MSLGIVLLAVLSCTRRICGATNVHTSPLIRSVSSWADLDIIPIEWIVDGFQVSEKRPAIEQVHEF
jgi:hypothetical protein